MSKHREAMEPLAGSAQHLSPNKAMPPELSDLHCFTETNGVITTTMFEIPGYKVTKVLGAVYGLQVRSRNWAASLGMVIKSVAGGELRWFTNMVRNPLSAAAPLLERKYERAGDTDCNGQNDSCTTPATTPSRDW